jgi:hypothetical protein
MAARKKAAEGEAAAAKPASEGGELYEALVAAAKKSRLKGELIPHRAGLYSRLQVDGRTVAYVVRGRTVATIYPNALAESAPADLTFKTVKLGSHHYGRGEIVVSVASEEDIPNAIAMLKASVSMPAVPRTAAAPVEAEAAA